ncbi:hypothetical protein [Enterobacter kobei]|uniref:hypothetical protein n=1 Tax=Enterobacter kobei TaxID=208224 RepID=UPI0030765E9F
MELSRDKIKEIINDDWLLMDDCEGNKNCDVVKDLARIALASLEAKSRKLFTCSGCGAEGLDEPLESKCHCNEDGALWVEGIVYTAPPAPVSVPDAMEMDDDFDSAFEHGKAVGWNACRAAMLQGANGTLTNEGTITATQFKPVADLYGLTSPTGGETSFTFDAVEARDFIDGGWSCQEYVELGRFQEAVSGNSPVIPDGWVMMPVEPTEEMLDEFDSIIDYGAEDSKDAWSRLIAAAPQQEVKP